MVSLAYALSELYRLARLLEVEGSKSDKRNILMQALLLEEYSAATW